MKLHLKSDQVRLNMTRQVHLLLLILNMCVISSNLAY